MDAEKMAQDLDFAEWVAGNKVIKGSIPLSHRYGGYQFGYWVLKSRNTFVFMRMQEDERELITLLIK